MNDLDTKERMMPLLIIQMSYQMMMLNLYMGKKTIMGMIIYFLYVIRNAKDERGKNNGGGEGDDLINYKGIYFNDD